MKDQNMLTLDVSSFNDKLLNELMSHYKELLIKARKPLDVACENYSDDTSERVAFKAGAIWLARALQQKADEQESVKPLSFNRFFLSDYYDELLPYNWDKNTLA